MSFKLKDFKCKDCEHITEVLVDSKEPDEKFKCEKCQSENMEAIDISIGSGKGQHFSWASWRVS
jgi:Zn finger protein HypA/HybF involved in hydrogenase expression